MRVTVHFIQLSSFASVRTGYSIRTRGQNLAEGPVRVIQARSFGPGLRINLGDCDYVDDQDINPEHFLRVGDIVFRTRGNYLDAGSYLPDTLPTVAAAPLVVIRVQSPQLLPDYLLWVLNHDALTRRTIQSMSAGFRIPALSTAAIADLPIPLPPLNVQKRIAEAGVLMEHELALRKRLLELTQTHFNAAMSQAARSHTQE